MSRVALVALLALTACGPSKPAEHPVTKIAEFDLQCPRDQLLYASIDHQTLGVQGCGRQALYVKLCRVAHEDCRWVRN